MSAAQPTLFSCSMDVVFVIKYLVVCTMTIIIIIIIIIIHVVVRRRRPRADNPTLRVAKTIRTQVSIKQPASTCNLAGMKK